MPPEEFEPTVPAIEWPQTQALDRLAPLWAAENIRRQILGKIIKAELGRI